MIKVKEPKEEKFTVLVDFLDLEDNSYFYKKGDPYPREGLELTAERIEELKTDKNKSGIPLIK